MAGKHEGTTRPPGPLGGRKNRGRKPGASAQGHQPLLLPGEPWFVRELEDLVEGLDPDLIGCRLRWHPDIFSEALSKDRSDAWPARGSLQVLPFAASDQRRS